MVPVTSCPVCETPIDSSALNCRKCGFPRALWSRLNQPVASPGDGEDAAAPAPGPPERHRSREADPEADVNASLARALEERTELLRTIDRDAPDVTGELCEAALNEASGRVSDAQQVLRSAQGRLERETEELLSRHLESLEARGRLLVSTGLKVAYEEDLGHLAEAIVAGPADASVAALAESERRMDGLEIHWRGLQGLIAQVTTLREEAAELGVPLGGIPDRLEAARASLATVPVTEKDVDLAAQAAAETLMHLHEVIPPSLEAELARHAATLSAHSGHPSSVLSLRRQHAEAVQHLKSGRLEDAVQSVRELRAALEELASQAVKAPEPAPAGTLPAPTPPPSEVAPAPEPWPNAPPPQGPPSVPVMAEPPQEPTVPAPLAPEGVSAAPETPDPNIVGTLMKKARSLAVRVRSLPPDSEGAADAAQRIHEATELLRARRYTEADQALTRLMRSLVSMTPPS